MFMTKTCLKEFTLFCLIWLPATIYKTVMPGYEGMNAGRILFVIPTGNWTGMMNDDADESLMVFEQNSPEIFDAGNKTFKMYTGEEGCCQIRLVKESLVGYEQSFWESILNCDIRAH